MTCTIESLKEKLKYLYCDCGIDVKYIVDYLTSNPTSN